LLFCFVPPPPQKSAKYEKFLTWVEESIEPILGKTISYHLKEKHNSSYHYIRVGTLTEANQHM
jgi:hypothetical protein